MNSPWVGLNDEHLTDDGRVYAYPMPFLQIKRYAVDKSRSFSPSWADTLTPKMNLFDAHSIVTDLGVIGILAILFAETGLLIGLAFPGDSLLFIAGIAASGTGAALLNGNQLPALAHQLLPLLVHLLVDGSAQNMEENYLIAPTEDFLLRPVLCKLKNG